MAQGKRTPDETRAYIQEIKLKDPELSTHDIEDLLR